MFSAIFLTAAAYAPPAPSELFSAEAKPIRTEIVATARGFEMRRNGQPYFVRGVGGGAPLDQLRQYGVNSVRTWGMDEHTGKFLDEAHRHGISVCLGFWMGHKNHGFDYTNPQQVREQFENAQRWVRAYKDHPAVLMWAVGNEMELSSPIPEMYQAVADVAAMIRREDSNHPVITVLADMWPEKMANVVKYWTDLDALGINSYGGLPTLHTRMVDWKKPYFITEYGFSTPQQENQTSFKRSYEPTSTEKGQLYALNTRRSIDGFPGRVLGGYLFYWGRSSVGTSSWFNTHLSTGEKLEVVDQMAKLWTGRFPNNRCPQITRFRFPRDLSLKPGETIRAEMDRSDPDGDALRVSYELIDDGAPRFVGDFEQRGRIVGRGPITGPVRVPAPTEPGIYRLLIVVRDGRGGAATAHIPLQVVP